MSVELDIWAIAAVVVILASIVYSVWKQTSFSIIASAACVAVLIIAIVAQEFTPLGGLASNDFAFMPHDILDPGREYTVLTSMFMHASFSHLFFNLLVLVLVGLVFEQRIGTRPFILIYLVAGVLGTLAFAALRWNDPFASVVGASGAIMGILGGFARLYPNEKMMFFFLPIPIAVWTIVLILVLLQLVFVLAESRVAVESHLAGLAAGAVLAPYATRFSPRRKAPSPTKSIKAMGIDQIRRLAVTPQLASIADRIELEEVPEVRNAWMEDFLSKAKCPQCGSRLRMEKDLIFCEKGHVV